MAIIVGAGLKPAPTDFVIVQFELNDLSIHQKLSPI